MNQILNRFIWIKYEFFFNWIIWTMIFFHVNQIIIFLNRIIIHVSQSTLSKLQNKSCENDLNLSTSLMHYSSIYGTISHYFHSLKHIFIFLSNISFSHTHIHTDTYISKGSFERRLHLFHKFLIVVINITSFFL